MSVGSRPATKQSRQERNLSGTCLYESMSTKAKLIGVLVVVVLAYALFSGDTEPVEVQVEE